MHIYISKFVLVLGTFGCISMSSALVFLVWVVSRVSAQHQNISPGILCSLWVVSSVLAVGTAALWLVVVKSILWRNKVIISFDDSDVSYWTKNYKELIRTRYDEIRKIDIETVPLVRGSQLFLQVHKSDGETDNIFVNNLGKSVAEIFQMFKEKCPHLVQPYSTVLILT